MGIAWDAKTRTISWCAKKEIAPGTELTYFYGEIPEIWPKVFEFGALKKTERFELLHCIHLWNKHEAMLKAKITIKTVYVIQ